MVRVVIIALFAAVTLSGCVTLSSTESRPGKATVISSYVTVESAARMMAAQGVIGKWRTAEKICNEAGYETGSKTFVNCFIAHQTYALRAAQTRAKAMTDAVARRHGLCIDRIRFEIARCTEI